jgi:hypothetical protein
MMNWHSLKSQMTQLMPKEKASVMPLSQPDENDQGLASHRRLIEENMGSVTLISKTDIYADSERRVLLLREGMEVPSDLLPKLISCGVDPAQFALKEPADISQLMDRNTIDVLKTIRSKVLSDKHVLVLDSQQKSIQRTINVLTRVGFSLGKIHPLRMPQYLSWSIEKYQPSVLVLDYELGKDENALGLLFKLQSEMPELLSQMEHVIVTMPVGAIPDSIYEGFLATVEALNIDVLFKPVMAKSLESILQIDILMPIDQAEAS